MREPKNTIRLTEQDVLTGMTAARLLRTLDAAQESVVETFIKSRGSYDTPGWYRGNRVFFPRDVGRRFLTRMCPSENFFYCVGWRLRVDLVFRLQEQGYVVLSKRRLVCLTNKARTWLGEQLKQEKEARDLECKREKPRRGGWKLKPLSRHLV